MDSEPITLINIFEIPQAEVDAFVQGWQERAAFLSRQPGFRSLRLHSALSPDTRYQLVNVAEWDSAEALHAATSQDFFQQSAQRSMQEFAVTAHPAIYRVAIEATAD
jgi:heme-degrading monooxygenase HmoA